MNQTPLLVKTLRWLLNCLRVKTNAHTIFHKLYMNWSLVIVFLSFHTKCPFTHSEGSLHTHLTLLFQASPTLDLWQRWFSSLMMMMLFTHASSVMTSDFVPKFTSLMRLSFNSHPNMPCFYF